MFNSSVTDWKHNQNFLKTTHITEVWLICVSKGPTIFTTPRTYQKFNDNILWISYPVTLLRASEAFHYRLGNRFYGQTHNHCLKRATYTYNCSRIIFIMQKTPSWLHNVNNFIISYLFPKEWGQLEEQPGGDSSNNIGYFYNQRKNL